MKRFLTIILSVLLIALVIFAVHSCTKTEKVPGATDDPDKDIVGTEPVNQPVPETNPEKEEKEQNNQEENDTVYTGVGIYHGRIDSSFIEITLDGSQPRLLSFRLAPELAEKFSSLNLEEESIISFEYEIVNDQYVITEIIK